MAQRGSYAGGGTGAKTVTIPVASTITYSVATVNDSSAEANGSIAVTLGAGAGYRVGSRSTATVAVMDDDTLLISVADATVKEAEGVELAFRVRLSQARTGTVTVKYATRDGTATAGEDYVAASGSLSFAAGETEQTVQVLVYNDSYDEGEREALDATSSSNGQKFEGELAYGMPAFGDRLTLTSALTLALSSDSATYGLPGPGPPTLSRDRGLPWELSLEGEREESSSAGSAAEHSLGLRFSLLF
ncbi:MAG: hypothetical protein OXF25_09720 [Cyanobacteria bacterium MAG CAR3_bin_5]|nr:hypothetical protein [Cyanobacteria bacterium MAG CAR3_bin_5]